MRFVRRCLLAVATSTLCLSSMNGWNPVGVDAACVASTGTSVVPATPDPDALTLFVTSTSITNGKTKDYVVIKFSDTPAATGLLAADQLCTLTAADSSIAKSSYNRNINGGTVQFTALLSTVGTDAISRVTSGKNIVNSDGDCLAPNILDLFGGGSGGGYDLGTEILTEDKDPPSQNQPVWTGTGLFKSGNAPASTANGYGQTFHAAGSATFSSSNFQCADWELDAGGGIQGMVGVGGQNVWIQQSETGVNCGSGAALYCISAQPFQGPTQPPTPTPTSGGNGDPQFVGLQGQSFQVHGMPEEFFNLITTPTFQLNSRFTYLASGECHYNNTECWTHPGTYVDQLGFMFPGIQIRTVAGSHRKGLRVWINDEEMKKSSGKVVMTTTSGIQSNSTISGEVTVSHPHHDVLIVSSPLFTIEVTNSDWFFNFNLMFHAPEILQSGRVMHYIPDSHSSSSATHAAGANGKQVYPTYPLHGLVGQTWKNARYPAKRMYQGEVDDYMLLDHTLFSTQFLFNLYAY